MFHNPLSNNLIYTFEFVLNGVLLKKNLKNWTRSYNIYGTFILK
jgi:hypothetical protein